MKGSLFKRCTQCGKRVPERRCPRCGLYEYSWGYVVDVGRDADGKRMQKWRDGFPTKEAAQRDLRELLASIDDGSYVVDSPITVEEYLMDEWLPATGPPRTGYDTWTNRRMYLRAYVIPRIGRIGLQDLNAAHLNRLYAELLSDGRVRGPGGLSPTSVRRVHAILRAALNDAVRWGRLRRNPTVTADPPPMKVVKAASRRSMKTWTADELQHFLEQTADDPHHALWFLVASTGLRRSEVLGVRWCDLDLDGRILSVEQTVRDSVEGHRPEGHQKSVTSARTIHLDRRTVEVLRAHRRTQDEQRRIAGAAWEANDLVFCRDDGRWYHPDSITTVFRESVEACDVPTIHLHDLRHTHATLLLRAGVNPKVVSERLGHSSVAFTLETYAHVIPGMQPEAAELFMGLVLGDGEDDQVDEGDAEQDDQGGGEETGKPAIHSPDQDEADAEESPDDTDQDTAEPDDKE